MNRDARRRWIRWPGRHEVMPWLAIVLFVGIGYSSLVPPRPVPAGASADRFSAERAMDHVGVIAREPHPVGTPANAKVRAYIVAELEKLGIDVELQTTSAPNYFGDGEPVPVVNVIARIPGTAHTKAVAFIGHYDTVPTTAGANANSAAVAALLEAGRALLAGPSLRNDVYLLYTDGEEPAPRFGATALVGSRLAMEDMGLVVNLEASGGSGASVLAEASGPERWLIEELAKADCHPAAFSFLTEMARLLGDIGTDFDSFRNAGATGLHFAYLHGSPIYHTEADNLDAVSGGSLQHHGQHVLGIARHFGDLDLIDPAPAERAVYFPVRPLLVRYSSVWAVPLALLATAVCAVGLWRRRASNRGTATIRNLIRTVGGGLLGMAAGTVLWLLITA
ncbi:MAG: M28 family peptidase, partial [Planctomycetota bacterium]